MAPTIRIDFARPIALFPLPSVVIYPHTADWMIAFEPRYRQLIEDCLRAREGGSLLDAAPIAMASYAGRAWNGPRIGEPPLRTAVCVTKIVEHRALPDGRHQVLLHGMSRATIETVSEPEGRRLYRLGNLVPLGTRSHAPRRLPALERELAHVLGTGELKRMQRLDPIREWIARGSVPTEFVVEQLVSILSRGDTRRYSMLAEPSSRRRSSFVLTELSHLSSLLGGAANRGAAPSARGLTRN
jgi:Lon protease-like protein